MSITIARPAGGSLVASSKLDKLQELLGQVKGEAKKTVLRDIRVERLRDQIRSCRACPLGHQRTKAVPWSGPVEGKGDFIIVGEAPGANEDHSGVPFVGQSGKLLDRLLENGGTTRDNCFVANTLCCRPPDNRDPRAYELHACKKNFEDQLKMSGLWLGVTLGGYALANVLGRKREDIRIRDEKEKAFWKDGRIWLATYHPSYALKNLDARGEIVATFRWAMNIRVGDINIPRPDFSELVVKDGSGKDLGKVIDKKGWAMIHSDVLATKIVLLKNETYANRVPRALYDLTQYTVEEWLKVGQIGAKRGGWTTEELRRLHFVKSEMGGEVVVG